ncbi:hypothetical protein M9978_08385 [Sphingomonas sp. MG17]|uniref:Uncharacterized protein n=1 Tax=Sphingomonas tagetis TaxID=2949092 RepID=A0A9X2HQ01_9SPHN|nr:hypothetical protein [Sphingomonas tagetis]MCP3730445.1 hypothetical protein [Sphingomonas tagetis]
MDMNFIDCKVVDGAAGGATIRVPLTDGAPSATLTLAGDTYERVENASGGFDYRKAGQPEDG